jgi:hypothetical protein
MALDKSTSADACVAFFGLRYEVQEHEIQGLELRSDSRIVAARKAGLKHYWGNFGGLSERHLLFIGAQLGVLGPENAGEINLSQNELQTLVDRTRARLEEAGLAGQPSFYLQWHPDV